MNGKKKVTQKRIEGFGRKGKDMHKDDGSYDMDESPHTPFADSHLTEATYIRSHCTISLLIWLHRVISNIWMRFGPASRAE